MVRFILLMTVFIGLAGCRDGPGQLLDPLDGRTSGPGEVTPSTEKVRSVIELINDPLVRELQGAVMLSTEPLDRAVREVSRYGTPNDMLALARVLAATTSHLRPREGDAQTTDDDLVLRAALALMLDDVRSLLDKPMPGEEQGVEVGDTNTRNPER